MAETHNRVERALTRQSLEPIIQIGFDDREIRPGVQAVIRKSRQKMKMQMVHGLAGGLTISIEKIEARRTKRSR